MLSEVKNIFENIKIFKHLLSEGVADNDIIKYIQNHEYVYIYYTGDENNKMGYRTIRPYVLGTSKSGNKVVRAWQDNKRNSVSFMNRPTRPDSQEHDYWLDDDGGVKPGWRMFRLDKISKIYPIGKKFHNSDGSVMIPPKYNEGGDADMTSIIAYVSSKSEPTPTTGEIQPRDEKRKLSKWDNFTRGNKNRKKIEPEDVLKLRDIASRVYKKNRGSFLVAINNNDEFELIDVKDKSKVPESAIVGTLPNLYDALVKKNAPADDKFFNDKLNKLKSDINSKPELKESNIPSIPFKYNTFFK